ncbi:hypothetical protein V8E51_002326 [Hyaloscypha variabilis]
MLNNLGSRSQGGSRRMALNACECCRQRKSKCDEGRPRCGRCQRLDLHCFYVDGSSRKEVMHPTIHDTLSRLEAKIDGLYSLDLPYPRFPARVQTLNADPMPLSSAEVRPSPAKSFLSMSETPMSSAFLKPADATTSQDFPDQVLPHHARQPVLGEFELAIPFRHSTAPQNILSWPCMQELSLQEDVRYPMRVELARSQDALSSLYNTSYGTHHNIKEYACWLDELSLLDIKSLTRYYFESSHPHTPVLIRASFQEDILASVLNKGWEANLNTCIVLLVFALGALSATDFGDDRWQPREVTVQDMQTDRDFDGTSKFFDLACGILERKGDVSWSSCQAHLLVGVFRSHQMRIYDSWRAVHQACTGLMILLQLDSETTALQSQIYWVAYLQESQLLAEFEFPPSGITRLESLVPLPFMDRGENVDSHDEFDFMLLAQIALRRLLNRIHFHMYNHNDSGGVIVDDSTPIDAVSPSSKISANTSILEELDHQLEGWRTHLPPHLHFPSIDALLMQDAEMLQPRSRTAQEKLLGFLKARYCAAKALIYRPSLYRIIHAKDSDGISEDDRRGAELSLRAAIVGPVYAGILWDNLKTIEKPINPCRSFFSVALLSKLFAIHEYGRAELIHHGAVISRIQRRLEAEIVPLSPIVAKDMEILNHLDQIHHAH